MSGAFLPALVCNKHIGSSFVKSIICKFFDDSIKILLTEKTLLLSALLVDLVDTHSQRETDKVYFEEKAKVIIEISIGILKVNQMDMLSIICKAAIETAMLKNNSTLAFIIISTILKSDSVSNTEIDDPNALLNMLQTALNLRKYYIFHVIFTFLNKNCPGLANQLKLGNNEHLYIRLYVLEKTRINISNVFIDFSLKHCIEQWLHLCYMSKNKIDKLPSITCLLSNIIRRHTKSRFTLTYCDILIKLGCDINTITHMHGLRPPIFEAISPCNIPLIRLQIYHGCNIDQTFNCKLVVQHLTPAELCFYSNNLEALKILFLCGAKTTPFLHENISIMSQKEIENPINKEQTMWLDMWIHNVPFLQLLCRNAIRKQLGRRVHVFRSTFEYPSYLKEFISTKYLE